MQSARGGEPSATFHRDRLAGELKQRGMITTPSVEAAFRRIARHLFLPGVGLEKVYADEAIVTKRENGIGISSSSQPSIMAIMLEQLGLQPGQRVLEIGAATGYNAALIASIVGESGYVVTVDIDDDLVEQAREHLAAAGADRVQVICADGGHGYAAGGPYDRIILSVGAWDIAPAWREQLKPGGRLVLPLSLGGPQRSVAFDWDGAVLRSASVKDCGFMLLRGEFAGPEGPVQLGPDAGLYLSADDRSAIDADLVYQLLTGPSQDRSLGMRVTLDEVFGGLSLWLALRAPGCCRLGAEGDQARSALVPPLFGWGPSRGTIAVLGGAGLAALMRPPGRRASEPRGGGDESPFDLWLRTFGDEGEAARLRELVLAWDSAGRPRSEELQIRAYPRGTNVERSPDDLVLEKRETTLVLDWGVKPAAGDRRPAINAPDVGSPSRRTRRDRSNPKASADGDRGLDADAIRASLESIARSGGQTLLSAVDVADVVVEGNWAAVILAREEFSAESLARVYRHLTSAFPHGGFELRAGARIYRGGAGFGEGRHVVAVLGGKGGVGKFTLAVNLALTLAAMGLPAGLLDADLNAPDLPHLLGIHLTKPLSGPGWRLTASAVTPPSRRPRPQEALGVELMSAGFVVPERFPPVISSRALVSSLLRYFVFEVAWRAQVLLIDAPPGTGEELQAVAGELPLSGAIFVTTPQDLAQMDAERTLTLLTDRGVPVIGVVQNMASLTCPHCAREIDLFAQSPRLAEAGLRPLGSIPFDVQLSAAADGGRPRVLGDPRGPIAYEFARIGAAVRRWLFDRGGIAREPAFGPAS